MSQINIVIPVLKGRTVFTVDRGRQWSLLEHLILESLAQKSQSSLSLSVSANLPRRIVVESVVRLMRAGWVEMHVEDESILFRVTPRGSAVASLNELPKLTERRKRPTNYVVDLISGEVFRNRDLIAQSEDELKKKLDESTTRWIRPSANQALVDVREALDVLLDPDETFVTGEPGGVYHKSVVVTVRDGAITGGLPEKRALPALREAILAEARRVGTVVSQAPDEQGTRDVVYKVRSPIVRSAKFQPDDLVLDGVAHQAIFNRVIREARTRLFIHSTFISQKHFEAALPAIEAAVERGVKVHVLWGQDEVGTALNSTQAAICELRRNPTIRRLSDGLIFHSYSTGSHSKILVADTPKLGEYVAVVGSCNWLTSSFNSYEASIVLREPALVSDVVEYIALLSCARDGVWTDLASDIVHVCQDLAKQKPASMPNAKMALVVGGHHKHFMYEARDHATKRVFVASHRLGAAAKPGVIEPLLATAKVKGIPSELFYGRRTQPVSQRAERSLHDLVEGTNVELSTVERPRLHAKVLAWDDDYIVCTSLNWLSADQGRLDSLNEAGVYVCAPNIANALVENFHAKHMEAHS